MKTAWWGSSWLGWIFGVLIILARLFSVIC
jgi:hypothetical protein